MSIEPTYKKITVADYQAAAKELGCEVAAIRAVASVESAGSGFILDPVANAYVPKILFERHKMHSFLKAKGYNTANYPSDIVSATRGGYKGGIAEHTRLQRACEINRECALKSCSWGAFQIMGFNYASLGYKTVQQFVNDMYGSEATQLNAFVRFIKADPRLVKALKALDWATFARIYNGSAYKENKYDVKMDQAYKTFK